MAGEKNYKARVSGGGSLFSHRSIDLQWFDYGDSEDRVRIKHGYDRNSNRLYRRNEVARAAGASFDELYTYDNLNRLTDAKRGLLNAGNTALPSKTFEQQWNLDQVGNWRHFVVWSTSGHMEKRPPVGAGSSAARYCLSHAAFRS